MPGHMTQTSTLAREKRICKRRDFLRIQKYGYRVFGRHIVVISQRTKDQIPGKFGITVPKKVGPAHERNLVKRRIRHVLRLNQDFFARACIVIIARASANGIDFSVLQTDILDACVRLNFNHRHHKKTH